MKRDVAPRLKVLSWNVENLRPYVEATPGALAAYVEAMGSPEVVCLQEVRVRPGDEALVVAMRGALPGYECHFALANDPRNVTFRGGRDLGRIDGDRHVWKRRFIERLAEECVSLKARGLALLLVGDWNVSRTKLDTVPRLRTEEPHATARAAFNDVFIPSLDVVDVFRELHPTARKYTWHRRGARRPDAARVDYALVSRTLLPRIAVADIDERLEARLASDHAPLWLTLRLDE